MFNESIETLALSNYEELGAGEHNKPFKDITPMGTTSKEEVTERSPYKYVHYSVHGRTLDERASSSRVLWEKDGILYGARDIKGTRHELIPMSGRKEKSNKPYEPRILGLYDETQTEYLLKVSKVFREAGIPSENVTKIYKIKEVVYEGKIIPVEEMFRKLEESTPIEEDKEGIRKLANNTEFYEVERDLQVSERIRDLAKCKTKEEFVEIIEQPIKWLNTVFKYTNQNLLKNQEAPRPFNIEGYIRSEGRKKQIQEGEFIRYLAEYLPTQMGLYLAKLRENGIKNDYDHAQQWSVVATMYDGQSFVGEPIDGQKLTEEDYIEALRHALGVLEELLNPSEENYIEKTLGKNGTTLNKAKKNLLKTYLTKIGIGESSEYIYKRLVNNFYFDGQKEHFRTLSPKTYIETLRELGIELSTEEIRSIYLDEERLTDKYEKMVRDSSAQAS